MESLVINRKHLLDGHLLLNNVM